MTPPATAVSLQEQLRRQGQLLRHPRELSRRSAAPFANLRASRSVLRYAAGVLRRGQGRLEGAGGEGARLPAVAARRLLRSRGRSRDDAEASDHQHARRTTRRSREVPPAARDPRRREHVRGRDVPENGDHRPRPEDDRGRVPARPLARQPGRLDHEVSRDITCSHDGRARRRPAPHRGCSCSGSTSSTRRSTWSSEDDTAENREVLERWESVLSVSRPSRCPDRELDWVAKYRLLEGYRERDGLDWSDHKLRADRPAVPRRSARPRASTIVSPRPARSSGSPTDEEVERAIMEPPEDTRAFFRGRCISRYPDAIAAASWDSVIMDAGRQTLQRDPDAGAPEGHSRPRRGASRRLQTAARLIDRLQA